MILLIENQESTQDLIIEILCHLTTITQESFGLKCYDTLSYLAKKSKVLRRKVFFLMKDLCLRNFYTNDLTTIKYQYLETFINVIADNNMGEIVGAATYEYITIWLNYIISNKFENLGINTELVKQVFRLLGIVASNSSVPFNQTIVSMLADKMFSDAKKLKNKIEALYNIMVEYICFTLTKYCERSLPKINVATLLYTNTTFMKDLVDEINVV